MSSKINESGYKNLLVVFWIIFCSGVVYFSYLSLPDNFAKREVRTVICAREMLASGNYLIPTLGGETRFEKPPLQYWLISLSAKLNQGLLTNASGRIPSIIAGILVLLLTWWWTLQLKSNDDRKKALLSPLILIIIPLFFLDVRSSEAEILLCFFILAASYFFWKASMTNEVSVKNLIFAYLFVAGGMLTKGPLALIMPLLPYIVVRRKAFLKEWKWHVVGIIILILPVGIWVLAAYIYYPESINIFIRELFIKRFGGEAKHAEPFYYYIILLLGQFAIFVPILFPAFQKTFKKKPEVKFNLYFIILNLIWLSIMSSKQRHYIEPIFPHLSILVGLWLGDQSKTGWVSKYFNIISLGLAVAVFLFGFMLLPQSLAILVAAMIGLIIIIFFNNRLPFLGLWKSALFFLVLMHLSNLFVTYTGNRLLPEQLMGNWIKNQPISKNQIAFAKIPDELLIYYLDNINQTVSSNDKDFFNTSDYLIVEGKDLVERFLSDKMFYLIKGIDKIKKGKIDPYLAFFGKTMDKPDETFGYSLLFLSNDGKSFLNKKEISSNIKLKTFYAIVPEMNPLVFLSPFSINNRMKWNQTYLPLLSQGVELICKFDPRSSLYRQAWFNDAAYWGVTPEILQQRSFYNGRYFLWTIDRADIDKAINQLEDELRLSSSLVKIVFFQKSSSNAREIPFEYVKRLKAQGVIIINELIFDKAGVAEMNIGYNGVTIQTTDSKGSTINSYHYPMAK
ncbi:MAG: phospholipid carrier-dependent glycosyltransferase [Desulfobacterales bacterium]|nr:phospholipid carrier-dependent glycosyltransferase [Desulfobacterales bacterium]